MSDFLHRALTKLEELQKRAEERRQKYGLWQEPREGLTDEEIDALDGARTLGWLLPRDAELVREFARAIEQALAAKWGVKLKGDGDGK